MCLTDCFTDQQSIPTPEQAFSLVEQAALGDPLAYSIVYDIVLQNIGSQDSTYEYLSKFIRREIENRSRE